MKKLFVAIAVLLSANSFAQYRQMPAAMKNSGHVYGKIVDAKGKPMEGASVLLLHQQMDTATKKMKMNFFFNRRYPGEI